MSTDQVTSKLPPVKADLHELEQMAKPSEKVLIRLQGQKGILMGCYYHGLECWQADIMNGAVNVAEWWPLPALNTGNKA